MPSQDQDENLHLNYQYYYTFNVIVNTLSVSELFTQLGEYQWIWIVGIWRVGADWCRRPRILFGASDQPVSDHRTLAFQLHVTPELQFKCVERVQYVFGRPTDVNSQSYK